MSPSAKFIIFALLVSLSFQSIIGSTFSKFFGKKGNDDIKRCKTDCLNACSVPSKVISSRLRKDKLSLVMRKWKIEKFIPQMVAGLEEIQKTCGSEQCKGFLKAPKDSLCQVSIGKVSSFGEELKKIDSKGQDEEGVKSAQEGVKKLAGELKKEISNVKKICTP